MWYFPLLKRGIRQIGMFVLLTIAAGGIALHWLRSATSNSLFDGPVTVCQKEAPTFYPRLRYDTKDYVALKNGHNDDFTKQNSKFATQTDAGEIAWVDGEARDEIKAAMRKNAGEERESPDLTRLRYDSCYRDRKPYQTLQIISPEEGAIYPPNLCPPFVTWEDPRNNLWQVSLSIKDESEPRTWITREKQWRFPTDVWGELRRDPINSNAWVSVKGIELDGNGERKGDIQATEPIPFSISPDTADDYIVYRLVAPPFSSYKTPDIHVRDIRKDQPDSFLSARREYCLNCHNFSSKQGNVGKLALQVRSLVKVSNNLPTYLAIYDIDKREGFKVRLPFEIQMTTFMAWSPDHSKLAYSANQKVAALKPIVFETQLAGMATSDIAIYDVESNDTYLVPGASDPNLLEIYPQWTPDGTRMIFSRSPVGPHPAHILFDLYILDLTSENPTSTAIEGASHNGKSNFYPHFSPDGRWFSFCQSDGGDLIRTSSDIYLKSGDLSGPSWRLEFNVDYAADSWHSWSSNSRWLVFASKREGGVYAYLYLSHIDDVGHASPAIPLPLIDRPLASYNIPEFVAHAPHINEKDMFDAIRVEPEPRVVQLRDDNHVQKEEKSG
ncbi:MAG: hypothetical protein C4527_25245 [Candidatus Omnitrophota bacterium]|jgi:hypothetical protein|nr:MAG: hypothetical protein C4527_25245 [Candidatus Omnitrophota bacterium]